MSCFSLPFFDELKDAQNILIAGAGGGFDVFCGLPLYFHLRDAGKTVSLANFTFSRLVSDLSGRSLAPCLVEVTPESRNELSYFPERYLSQWFRNQATETPIYCIERAGPSIVSGAYRTLVELLKLDTIILVDGGTDSLMRGDEEGLGTPLEDMISVCAVDQVEVARKMLVCLGFGIDAFHGVCHAHVLEAVADLIRSGGYLGAFSLMIDMPEVRQFADALEYVLAQMPGQQSIVNTSILSALEGQFGDHHRTLRTKESELFINPLMSLYWCFRLEQVARRVLYLDGMREIASFTAVDDYISRFHESQWHRIRKRRGLPF